MASKRQPNFTLQGIRTRITNSKIELDEEIENTINEKLNIINNHILNKPQATFTYFIPDKKKKGGSYSKITSNVKHIDLANNIIILTKKKKINILDIINIDL